MKTSRLVGGTFIASAVILSACGEQQKAPTVTNTVQAAENKMVVLPANMTLAQAVIHPPRATDGFGTLEQQTIGAFNGLHTLLQKQNMTLGNVMGIRAVLVPDAQGKLDYDTYMSAYKKFFGTKELPATPLHSVSATQSLPVTGQLIMLEANIAVPVKPKQQKAEK